MSASLHSTPLTGQPSEDDWQEDVYQKIKTMKESYLPQLNEINQKLATKLNQRDSPPHQPKTDKFEKLMVFKTVLDSIIAFLQVSKSNISLKYKEKKLDHYEKLIINFIDANKPKQAILTLQQGQLPPPRIQGSVAAMQQSNMTTSLHSTPQTGQPSDGDWQEDVYQKIKTMKENYLPQLNEINQKLATKLHQHDSPPHQPKTDKFEKLMVFKTLLDRSFAFLQVSKSNISLKYMEKLDHYEKQIINFIDANKPKQAIPTLQQGQLPPPHIQGSVAAMRQSNMTSMQHNLLSNVSTAQQSTVDTTAAAIFPTSSSTCIRMRVSEIAKTMIDKRLTIQPDTEGWHLAQELLSLARPPSTEGL